MPRKEIYWKDPERHRNATHRYYLRNHAARIEYAKRFYETDHGKQIQKDAAIRVSHRLSLRIYKEIESAQGGACAVCKGTEPRQGKRRLCVDHDHATGAIRGLLCFSCNVAIGAAKESAARLKDLAAYLERPPLMPDRVVLRKRRLPSQMEIDAAIRKVGRPRKS